MFDKRFVSTAVALAAVAALSFFLTASPSPPDAEPIAENLSGIGRNADTKPAEKYDYAYVIKEHEGRVAVYQAGADQPEVILDVLVKYLPDYDRSQMSEGIYIKTYDELILRIEDYTS